MKISSNRSIRWLAYRVVRRFAIANICYFYQTPIDKMPRTPTPDGYTMRSCSSKQIRDHASELDDAIPERDLQMLDAGKSKCFAAFHGESLAGFAWAAFENIPAEMNHDGKPETGLPIQLSDEAAFVFQVLVLPAYRGRRLYAAILSRMADELQRDGIRHLVLTTEGSNHNALRAVERMQFQKVGQASFFRIGPLSRSTYPTLSKDVGFTIGRYLGDETAAHSS
jgi:ribosomal protein S18 acetylase RimI-like enzyme